MFKFPLIIADFYNTPIGNVKSLLPNFFDKEKYVLYYEHFFDSRTKTKKKHCVL